VGIAFEGFHLDAPNKIMMKCQTGETMEAAKKVAIDVLQFISIQVKMLQMGQSIKRILLDLTDLVALQVKCLQLGI